MMKRRKNDAEMSTATRNGRVLLTGKLIHTPILHKDASGETNEL
jgi:hypothetical protein